MPTTVAVAVVEVVVVYITMDTIHTHDMWKSKLTYTVLLY